MQQEFQPQKSQSKKQGNKKNNQNSQSHPIQRQSGKLDKGQLNQIIQSVHKSLKGANDQTIFRRYANNQDELKQRQQYTKRFNSYYKNGGSDKGSLARIGLKFLEQDSQEILHTKFSSLPMIDQQFLAFMVAGDDFSSIAMAALPHIAKYGPGVIKYLAGIFKKKKKSIQPTTDTNTMMSKPAIFLQGQSATEHHIPESVTEAHYQGSLLNSLDTVNCRALWSVLYPEGPPSRFPQGSNRTACNNFPQMLEITTGPGGNCLVQILSSSQNLTGIYTRLNTAWVPTLGTTPVGNWAFGGGPLEPQSLNVKSQRMLGCSARFVPSVSTLANNGSIVACSVVTGEEGFGPYSTATAVTKDEIMQSSNSVCYNLKDQSVRIVQPISDIDTFTFIANVQNSALLQTWKDKAITFGFTGAAPNQLIGTIYVWTSFEYMVTPSLFSIASRDIPATGPATFSALQSIVQQYPQIYNLDLNIIQQLANIHQDSCSYDEVMQTVAKLTQ